MRRVIALWLSVSLATIAGIAAAQDASEQPAVDAPTADATPAGEGSGDATAASTTDAVVTSQPAPAVAQADEAMDAGTYATRLRDLEQRIDSLKEQIFRSKARLSLLAETVLQGVVAGAQAVIVHENRMSSSYRLVKASYSLDGARIFNRADEEGPLADQTEFDVYNGSIVPGDHNLTVNLEYRGNGYGIFSYLKGYRFRVRSSYTFSAPEGKAITVRVVGYEKGGPTAPLEERPAVRYLERTESRSSQSGAAASESGE